jgi:DNA polymerase I
MPSIARISKPVTAGRPGRCSVSSGLLLKLLRERQPQQVGVAFDISRETFRRELFPDYKAQRKPTPPELLKQLPLAHEAVKALGIPALTLPGFEADDVIGSLAETFKADHDVTILTGDRDLLQLIDDRVVVELCVKGVSETRIFDRATFQAEYGFPPLQIIDFKALMGDSSDNIPGVKGIGEKKGLALVRQFGTLAALWESPEKIDNVRVREMVLAGKEEAELSYRLATIRRDLDLSSELSHLAWSLAALKQPRLASFLQSWEFSSLLVELDLAQPPHSSPLSASPSSSPSSSSPSATIPADRPPMRGDGAVVAPQQPSLAGFADEQEPGPPESHSPGVSERSFASSSPPNLAGELGGERLLARSVTAVQAFLEQAGSRLALDIETDGLDPRRHRIIGLSLARSGDQAMYIPLRHAYLGLLPEDQPEPAEIFALLGPALANRVVIGHNLKFDFSFLRREGIPLPTRFFDTMLASYVCDPTTSNALKELARDQLGLNVRDFASVAGRGSFAEVSLADAAHYCCQDSLLAWQLAEHLETHLRKAAPVQGGLLDLFEHLEQPLLPLLMDMEDLGIGLNRPYLSELRGEFARRMRDLEASIHAQAGTVFNVNSGKQLQEVLFDRLGLTPPKRIKTGFSTDSEVLHQLAAAHPICADLLAYRELAKLQSTYVDALGQLVDPNTGCVHSNFNQTVTATGRLSSSNPNLQNIPIKTELGRCVRRAFVPPRAGDVFLSLDYSQIELRLLAHLAEDPALIEAFREGRDIHQLTAARLFQKPPEQVTDGERKFGKTVNFGIIYGISAHGLAQDLGITRVEAKAYIDHFFAGYPGVTSFFARTLERAQHEGKVETIFGRIRPLPELTSGRGPTRAFGERVARNTPLQGSAADLVKKAMLDADREVRRIGAKARLVLQIHDELVFSLPPEEVPKVGAVIRAAMENAVELRVPLVCDPAVGSNLADLASVDLAR